MGETFNVEVDGLFVVAYRVVVCGVHFNVEIDCMFVVAYGIVQARTWTRPSRQQPCRSSNCLMCKIKTQECSRHTFLLNSLFNHKYELSPTIIMIFMLYPPSPHSSHCL